jgi:hypothetical protein
MTDEEYDTIIYDNLVRILLAMESQKDMSCQYGDNTLPFDAHIQQLRTYIEQAGEYAIAYESIVATLESMPFTLSGAVAVYLLEVGLLMRYKTSRDKDRLFDCRD